MIHRPVSVALALVSLLAGTASAQSGDGYDASWTTVDGGGGQSAGGDGYAVGATIGQPDAEVVANGESRLSAGFWRGATAWRGASGAGDVNCDGRLSAADLVALLVLIPTNDPGACGQGDVDLDGTVDENDIAALVGRLFIGL